MRTMSDIEILQADFEWETAALAWRRNVDLPEVCRRVREHIAEMGRQGYYMRLLALLDQVTDAEEDLYWRYRRYEANAAAGRPYAERAIIAAFIPEHEREVEKMSREIDRLRNVLFRPEKDAARFRITDEQIERARAYPIENLVEVNRAGMARCISGEHEDRHASMQATNGFVFCHSCGFKGDAIALYMKLNGTSFTEAVRALQ